jgi:hypothetical protein
MGNTVQARLSPLTRETGFRLPSGLGVAGREFSCFGLKGVNGSPNPPKRQTPDLKRKRLRPVRNRWHVMARQGKTRAYPYNVNVQASFRKFRSCLRRVKGFAVNCHRLPFLRRLCRLSWPESASAPVTCLRKVHNHVRQVRGGESQRRGRDCGVPQERG